MKKQLDIKRLIMLNFPYVIAFYFANNIYNIGRSFARF